MVSVSNYRRCSKIWKKPKNPYEKLRIVNEVKIINQFGLKNKKELWKIQYFLSKMKKISGKVLRGVKSSNYLEMQKNAILWFCFKYNLFNETKEEMNYIMKINLKSLLNRRLQTFVKNKGIAKTIHESRILILHRHIQINLQVTNKPGILIRKDNESTISISKFSILNKVKVNLNKTINKIKKKSIR